MSIGSIASDPALDPALRVRALRDARDDLKMRIKGEPDGTDTAADLTALMGQTDTYIGSLELEREARSLDLALASLTKAEDADLRDDMAMAGHPQEALDAAGLWSHAELEQARRDGVLEEMAFGLAADFREDLVKRDHGRFSTKNVAGAVPGAPAAPKPPAAPKLVQRGGKRAPLPGSPRAAVKPQPQPPMRPLEEPPQPTVPHPAQPVPLYRAPKPPQAAPEGAPTGRKETDEAIRTMFHPDEAAKAKQSFADGPALFAQAEKDFEPFKALLTGSGLASSLGALEPGSLEEALGNATRQPDKPQVVMGPMKKMERAQQKVDTKYEGDWNRLQDVLRATAVVPSLEHMPAAMEALRQHAEDHGWQIVKAENRFSEPPPPHNTGATPVGYRDMAVGLVSPGGVVSELQFNTTAMFHAKQSEGHHIYEEQRSIEAAIKARSTDAEGKPHPPASPGTTGAAGIGPTPEESARLAELTAASKKVYNAAYEASYAG